MNLCLISSLVSKASNKEEIMEKCEALSRSSSTDSQGWIMLSENVESTKSEQVGQLVIRKLAPLKVPSPDLNDKSIPATASRGFSPRIVEEIDKELSKVAAYISSRSNSPQLREKSVSRATSRSPSPGIVEEIDKELSKVAAYISSRSNSPQLREKSVSRTTSRSSSPEIRASFIEEINENFSSVSELPKQEDVIRSRAALIDSSISLHKKGKEPAIAVVAQETPSAQLKRESGMKKAWHRRAPPKPSNIQYDFPKIEVLARENPSALISQFFKDAKRLEEIDPVQLKEKERVQARMARVQDLAFSHIRKMPHTEISEYLTSSLFSSNIEADSIEYPLKHALLGEFSVRSGPDYKALQDDLLRNGKPLNMVVFRNTIPDPEELQQMGRALGKDHIKVVGIDSNPTITHFPKSLRALGNIEEIRVSDSPNLTNPYLPKELSFLRSVTINGRSYSLKSNRK